MWQRQRHGDLCHIAGSGGLPAVMCSLVAPRHAQRPEWARELNRRAMRTHGRQLHGTEREEILRGTRRQSRAVGRSVPCQSCWPRIRASIPAHRRPRLLHGAGSRSGRARVSARFIGGTLAAPVAFAAFYPVGCNVRLVDEADASGGAVRIFHGTATLDDRSTAESGRTPARAGQGRLDRGVEARCYGFDIPSMPRRGLPRRRELVWMQDHAAAGWTFVDETARSSAALRRA